jgi:hypothetical protein
MKSNAREISAEIKGLAADAADRGFVIVQKHGQLLQTRVRAKASGRPGPRVQTGDYRRSIALDVFRKVKSAEAHVGTNKPQANRLEYGFHGADSLGRHYNQAPLPHFGPALDEIGPAFIEECGTILDGFGAKGKIKGG